MEPEYTVRFRPGEYSYMGMAGARPYFSILRNGQPYAFAFSEEAARHLTLALSIADAYAKNKTATAGELVSAVEKIIKGK